MTVASDPSLLQRYSLDASFLLDFWSDEGQRPRDVYRGIWEAVDEGVKEGAIISPVSVRKEVRDTKDSGLKSWLSTCGSMFVQLDRAQVSVLEEIVRKFPAYAEEVRNLADPTVIALAKVKGLTVLTSEKWVLNMGPTKPKIPNVCEDFGVKCLDIDNYCRAESIELTRS
jgi:hypothetical protein